ncbi:helix-turn-helix domain-containing protein [Paenibacillus apiarius]|uniref:helix-turn-helix domain-containing protein n=1 Tax=Paenibacillus apiarius TaxID=46240 RepID=UPI0019817CB8|nr:transposase [Paenibacillus apiarius]
MQEKLAVLQEIENGEMGLETAAKKHGIGTTTLIEWRDRYELYGYEGLEHQTHNRSYSAELKLQAVKNYLFGELSQSQIIRKSRTQLRNWIKKYNSHSSLKTYVRGAKAMAKGRSTTWQERVDIVLYCLAHDHEYQKTANQYQVSYQQVYQWVKKYEAGGEDALRDGRVRKKASKELSEVERQKLPMKKLEYEIVLNLDPVDRIRFAFRILKQVSCLQKPCLYPTLAGYPEWMLFRTKGIPLSLVSRWRS